MVPGMQGKDQFYTPGFRGSEHTGNSLMLAGNQTLSASSMEFFLLKLLKLNTSARGVLAYCRERD